MSALPPSSDARPPAVPDDQPAGSGHRATGARRGPTRRRTGWRRGSVATAVVALAAGLLFATNASVFAGTDARHPQDLEGLARAETDRLVALEEENAELREAIRPFVESQPQGKQAVDGVSGPPNAVGLQAVKGPGLRVQLWDAPPRDDADPAFAPDTLVVHQQDLEAVMNALWAGGAEAMTVQGHRVISTTGVRCVGNVLHIAGRTYSPPYVVEAIGDPDELESSLLAAPGVQIYLQYVEAVGLGWSMNGLTETEMPAYSGTLALRHAEVLDDIGTGSES
ncbi:DUF881 domain-containing protein [Georgenia subflava]|uniref:DUF881 domain-containing protein n=1 Tax=Georgenia subflava TaxID=1622177 RepID=A0A6N7ELI6_9MICO|nr:DUF881 domain-containing protein [Georgenia subflava]MPV38920.1 DUF881 domain-containing protein [Georgenia subflava]